MSIMNKYFIVYRGMVVGETSFVGAHWVHTIRVRDKNPNYFCHRIYFDPRIYQLVPGLIEITEKAIVKVFQYWSPDGSKYRTIKKDLLSELRKIENNEYGFRGIPFKGAYPLRKLITGGRGL